MEATNLAIVTQPTLGAERLILRPFTLADAPDVQRLAGEWDIAARTLVIPHPYPDGLAEQWIRSHPKDFAAGNSVTFAIALLDNTLCGAIGLGLVPENQLAELGYWIGKPYWGNGYCTEAAKALLKLGFNDLGLNRIQATHYTDNPASGRVMQKIGMAYEGCRRQHTFRWGEFKDIKLYGILKSDWLNGHS
ncbi:GNAT family N-acetyltransferase [Pseudanabaena sp. FACHB-2040]|uniref:GNAT family N-acetyltransferase n=1 Tax=Pseudanabaena sp. FACHB-2040 TaxID=2692859 RepID=UPI00168797CF|nr:GNAT family N-acetyltransferase [Pseudanabaena sp. FACHB-2040]MBD2259537.1 GNAT family N-acetyltransferase [Pseudanabaena sp. FACHB-2040]